MRALQEKFLNEHNIDTFLSAQDGEILEYFHQNYNRNHHQIRVNVENKVEEAKSSSNDDIAADSITEKPQPKEQEDIIEESPDMDLKNKNPGQKIMNPELFKMIKREQDQMF